MIHSNAFFLWRIFFVAKDTVEATWECCTGSPLFEDVEAADIRQHIRGGTGQKSKEYTTCTARLDRLWLRTVVCWGKTNGLPHIVYRRGGCLIITVSSILIIVLSATLFLYFYDWSCIPNSQLVNAEAFEYTARNDFPFDNARTYGTHICHSCTLTTPVGSSGGAYTLSPNSTGFIGCRLGPLSTRVYHLHPYCKPRIDGGYMDHWDGYDELKFWPQVKANQCTGVTHVDFIQCVDFWQAIPLALGYLPFMTMTVLLVVFFVANQCSIKLALQDFILGADRVGMHLRLSKYDRRLAENKRRRLRASNYSRRATFLGKHIPRPSILRRTQKTDASAPPSVPEGVVAYTMDSHGKLEEINPSVSNVKVGLLGDTKEENEKIQAVQPKSPAQKGISFAGDGGQVARESLDFDDGSSKQEEPQESTSVMIGVGGFELASIHGLSGLSKSLSIAPWGAMGSSSSSDGTSGHAGTSI